MSDPSLEEPPIRPSTISGSHPNVNSTSSDNRVPTESVANHRGTSSSQTVTIVTKEGIRWEGSALPSLPASVLPIGQDSVGVTSQSNTSPNHSSQTDVARIKSAIRLYPPNSIPSASSAYNLRERISSDVIFKEDFDYEGRTRIEKKKDQLVIDYDAYLQAHHTEITHLLQDIVLNLLIHQPERPLKDIRSYVRSRKGL